MKRRFKLIVYSALIVLLLMQFYQPARNIALKQDYTADFAKTNQVPKNIENVLKTSCYDCHSNNTYYPWYSYIQPVRLFMDSHINEGKEELNFNEFGQYSKRRQNKKLSAIIEEIKSNEMPLISYTLIHRNAILSDKQKRELISWIEKTRDSISLKH